jgi:enamine deaminase RidA (YjgF/YER057c/UK114 family)
MTACQSTILAARIHPTLESNKHPITGHCLMRTLISSGSPLEPRIGFSRAVRIGNLLTVAGTAPIAPDGSVAAPNDVLGQTMRCLEIIAAAVHDAGMTLGDVVRTRIMLTDIDTWRDAARAHGEYFSAIRPACTFVGVSRFIDPGWLVEVEADCVAQDAEEPRTP